MSKSVIKVQNLSKRYRLGLKEKQSETLAGQIGNIVKSPWQNLKRLRDLNRFNEEDESVFWALKDVSFEIKEGEVLGIIGKNGAGKSTLLKILSQITEPTSGKIEIHGRVASLLEVGTGFHPELSGRENIYMNGTILGMTRREIDSKLDEIIDFSGVEKFIDTPVKFYSSGMKVRLGFSVAAHLDPEILIIDEVLAVGDYEFQKKCLGKMEDVSKNQGRTVLFVSHNMASIQNLSSRGLLLELGQSIFQGDIQVTVDKYVEKNQSLTKLQNSLKSQDEYAPIKILSLRFFQNDIEVNKLISGNELTIKFEIFSSQYFKGVSAAIGFFSQMDERKIVFFSEFKNKTFDIDEGNGTFVCKIDKFPLSAGILKFNLLIKKGEENINWIRDAGTLEIEDGDFYGTGRVLKLPDIICHVEQSWSYI